MIASSSFRERALMLALVFVMFVAAAVPFIGNFYGQGWPWYDPRAYGAACDGSTDDTAAMNALFAAVPANGPFTIVMPGLCKITAPITITGKQNGSIVAWGGGGANAAAANGAPGIYCYQTTGNCLNVYGDTITISGIAIQRRLTATSGCSIDLQGSSHTQLDKLVLNYGFNNVCLGGHTAPYGIQGDIDLEEVSGTTVAGGKAFSDNGNTDGVVLRQFHFGGPQDSSSVFFWIDPTQTVDTIDFQSGGCFGFGRHVYVAPNSGHGDIDIFISKMLCDGATGGGAGVTIAGAGQAGVAIDHSFFGSFHENDNCGVEVGGGNPIGGSIKETQVSGFGRAGVCFDSTPPGDFVLAGNTIEGNSNTTPDTYPAIQFAAGSGHARIYDNYLNGNGSQDYAIKFLGNADLVVIRGNELGGDTGNISYGPGTLTRVSIYKNTLYNAPSQYDPQVNSNATNTFTQPQIFNTGNYYSSPQILITGNNNPGLRITDTFGTLGTDGADWSIGGGQSNSGGADCLNFLDARAAYLTIDLSLCGNTGNLTLLKSGSKFVGKHSDPAWSATTGDPLCVDNAKTATTTSCNSPQFFPLGTASLATKFIGGTCASVANAGTVCTFPGSKSFADTTFTCPSITAEGATPHSFSYDTKTTTGFTAYADAGTPTIDYLCWR